jgi:hypothetical protein
VPGVDQERRHGDRGDGGGSGEHPDENELDRPGEHQRGDDRGQPPGQTVAGDKDAEPDAEGEQAHPDNPGFPGGLVEVRRLEAEGVIIGYTAIVNPAAWDAGSR